MSTIKMRSKESNGVVTVKALIKHPMETPVSIGCLMSAFTVTTPFDSFDLILIVLMINLHSLL